VPSQTMFIDFEIDTPQGGALTGRRFPIEAVAETIDDEALVTAVLKSLRGLAAGQVTIRGKHPGTGPNYVTDAASDQFGEGCRIDLSHVIEDGMITYKGLPAPLICDHLSRQASREHYDPGTEFQIDRINMVGNTGTYLDTPFHRYQDGADLADLPLSSISDCPGVVIDVRASPGRLIDCALLAAAEIRGRAVLLRTGWDKHWRTDQYFEDHPYLSEQGAIYLRDRGARLVGIDSMNIDDIRGGTRPVHSILLGAGIPIVEHMTRLDQLPSGPFRFFAVPPKIRNAGTFPVRAHAIMSP